MATGDQADILNRLKRLLPGGWFAGDTPILDAALTGPAWALSGLYDLYVYAKLQTRLATATDGFLDLWAWDFFGPKLIRKAGQTDAQFRALIQASIFRERNTRAAITKILTDITGRVPIVREPRQTRDANVYRGVGGYRVGRPYGSVEIPFEVFVDAYRPTGGGGFTSTTDADIYAAVEAVRPAAVTVWVRISN